MNTDRSVSTIDEYIRRFPSDVQTRLQSIRKVVHKAAPEAEERISYGMPTFGRLVAFAAFKEHISLFPGAATIAAFSNKLAHYKTAKGTVRFPYGSPLPLDLIERMVRFAKKA
jgi:uncharacterized protein YdhG (YjbR/CyaY superfamily)